VKTLKETGTVADAETISGASRMPKWVVRELAGADRGILMAICLEQLALSLLLLTIPAMAYVGHRDVILLYTLVGCISAFALFFNRPLPRIISMLWHAASPFVKWLTVSIARGTLRADYEFSTLYLWWGFIDTVVVLYLATTAVIQYRIRRRARQPL
jgi:hypothetical protein